MKWSITDAGIPSEFQLAADSVLRFIKRWVMVTALSHSVLIKSKQPHPRCDEVILCILHLRWLMTWARETDNAGNRPCAKYWTVGEVTEKM